MKKVLFGLIVLGSISAFADSVDRSGDYYCRPVDVIYNRSLSEQMLKVTVRKDFSAAEVYEPAPESQSDDTDYKKMLFKQDPSYILRRGAGMEGLSFKLHLPNNFGGNTYRSFTLAGATQSDGQPETYETLVSKDGVFSVVSTRTPSDKEYIYTLLCVKP